MLINLNKIRNNKKVNAIILGAGYGRSTSFRGGAENGPREIIKCFDNNLEIFDRFTKNEPFNIFDFGYFDLKGLNRLNPENMVKSISDFFLNNKEKFILMLGGDHSVSIGAFSYFAKYSKPSEITILQIDAHPDLRDNTSDYKKISRKIDHACVMRRAYEMNFKTVQVGIRTYSIYDHDFIMDKKLKVFEWGRGRIPSVKEIIDEIKTDKVYLTFDIDGLDPSHAPATGTPVPGGIGWEFALNLIRELIYRKNLIGSDIVEVSPFKDDVLTQYSAAHLCYNILSYKLMKEKGILKFYYNK